MRGHNETDFKQRLSDVQSSEVLTLTLSNLALHEQVHATYILKSCNDLGCIESDHFNIPSGLLGSTGYFKSPYPAEGQAFGWSVALSGDGGVMAVGAYSDSTVGDTIDSAQSEERTLHGAVFIYRKQMGSWAYEAFLQASNKGARDFFGTDISLNGDGTILAIGASGEDGSTGGQGSNNSSTDAGVVYIYNYQDGIWVNSHYLKAVNTNQSDYFGSRVQLNDAGNILAVSAHGKETYFSS